MKRSVRKNLFINQKPGRWYQWEHSKEMAKITYQAGFLIRAAVIFVYMWGHVQCWLHCFAGMNLYQITWGRILISGRLLLHSMEWGSTHEGHMKLRKAPIFGTAQYIVLLIRAVKQKNSFFFLVCIIVYKIMELFLRLYRKSQKSQLALYTCILLQAKIKKRKINYEKQMSI